MQKLKTYLILITVLFFFGCEETKPASANQSILGSQFNTLAIQEDQVMQMDFLVNKHINENASSTDLADWLPLVLEWDKQRVELFNCLEKFEELLRGPEYGNESIFLVLENAKDTELALQFWQDSQKKAACTISGANNLDAYQNGIEGFFSFLEQKIFEVLPDPKIIKTVPHWYNLPRLNFTVPHSRFKTMGFEEYVLEGIDIQTSLSLIYETKLAMLTWEYVVLNELD